MAEGGSLQRGMQLCVALDRVFCTIRGWRAPSTQCNPWSARRGWFPRPLTLHPENYDFITFFFFSVINQYGFHNLASEIGARSWLGLVVSAAFCRDGNGAGAHAGQEHLHHQGAQPRAGRQRKQAALTSCCVFLYGLGLMWLCPCSSLLPAHLDPLPHLLQP